ncbi:MAG: hypothetical protein U5L10_05250 [Candidatus Moranbacteria bacterium]|nr:hypothetical protein [Candidatus Moranbacteria bacterium]
MKKNTFNPLIFLASLGAGGIAVMPFAFLQYTVEHGSGLVKLADLGVDYSSPAGAGLVFLFAVMVVFALIHLGLTAFLLPKLFRWVKTSEFKEVLNSPLKNASLLAPFISLAMTMNVFIGPVRFFSSWMAANLQSLMLPALIFWSVLWVFLMYFETKLLKISFSKGFDVNKISFGWLLHPFALGMLTVVGTGIAAMAKDPGIASTAALLSIISGSMGIFLLAVKMIMIFKSHFNADGLPEKQFLPSFLIVVPNITLYSISAFRLGHYLENSMGMELGAYYFFAVMIPFAFEVWYLAFGLALLSDYFKKHFWKKEFYVTQWGLICPIVAFGVLGSFAYKIFPAAGGIFLCRYNNLNNSGRRILCHPLEAQLSMCSQQREEGGGFSKGYGVFELKPI